jgi:hypothetical protein
MRTKTTTIRTDSITPTFRGIYVERFFQLIQSIEGSDAQLQRNAVSRELAWCDGLTHEGLDRFKYRAMLLVLRDLMGQGWQTRYRQRTIYLSRPDYTRGKHLSLDPAVVKDQIRNAHRDERLAKINAPSTVRFIRGLEEPKEGKLPILELVASGSELAHSLRSLPAGPTIEQLRGVINPYLQLVRNDERDPISGHKLIDIWRYFRYLWAIPYQPTPGRNLFYLVRDAARPNHPVIGISALGNCVVQLSERDHSIGWSLEGIERILERRNRVVTRDLPKDSPVRRTTRVEYLESEEEHEERVSAYAAKLAETLVRSLDHEFSQVNRHGLASARECQRPTDALIKRLIAVAGESENARQKGLRESHAKGKSAKRTKSVGTVQRDSESPLFVRKRAQALADIVFTRLVFQKEELLKAPLQALQRMLQHDAGRKALRIALHSNKKTKIGSSMMDIIVCGAIPPYSEMLGGKLVAMLMASPQVVREYRESYGDQVSEIVSRVAGTRVVRPADLVFLTTTSLYHVGSSQYERIRIPGPHNKQVTFDFIGHTEGYGSIALSSEASDSLRDVAIEAHGMRRVNNIFGEGVSPRMRMTREGLGLIGVPQDLVLKHNCPRLIYGVRLAANAFEYLRGEAEKPQYILSRRDSKRGTQEVIDHWLLRWLYPRSRRAESLSKIEALSSEELRLSREVSAEMPQTASTERQEARDARVG